MLTSYLSMYEEKKISNEMKTFLNKCGIDFIADNVLTSQQVSLSTAEKILCPDPTGFIRAISLSSQIKGCQHIKNAFNPISSTLCNELREAVIKYNGSLPNVTCDLNLFEVYDKSRYTSINKLKLVYHKNIPSMWKSDFADIIERELFPAALLSRKDLVINCWEFEDVARCLLNNVNTLSVDEKESLYIFILQYISLNQVLPDFICYIKQNISVKCGNGRKKPSELYLDDKDHNVFKSLFYGEENKFPDLCYEAYLSGLRKLGLKTEIHQVTRSEVKASIESVYKYVADKQSLYAKVKSILSVSIDCGFNLSEYTNICWIPIRNEKPPDYPLSLQWFGFVHQNLEKPLNVFLPEYSYLIGSTSKIVDDSVSELFKKTFVKKQPDVQMVCDNMRNVINSYNEDERGRYKTIITNLYNTFSPNDASIVANYIRDMDVKVWQGVKLVDYSQILLKKLSINVEPYYYYINNEIPQPFTNILQILGCEEQEEINIYKNVLETLMKKYENLEIKASPDLELSINLLKYIADSSDKLSNEERLSLCLPVDSDFIRFCRLQDCCYHDGSRSYASISNFNLVHKSIGKEIQMNLGIVNLVSQILTDDNDIFESWGQHESLTLRLNRLLKDYEDGLAIPKELIQNADDAGATTVSFLYDQRENQNLKTALFNPDMKDWQGPALWVFNNAMFSEDDFKNLTRLNAGTKELDTTKIGRFGLGFNAVYHLTDVPSLISDKTMVMFDPHTTYLGEVLKDKDRPGVKINLLKSKTDYIHFNDQFKVFHDVFDAKMDFSTGNVEAFNGTLFRLPLRNHMAASKSEINSKIYDDSEMQPLLKMLKESLDDLLLFTQNVKKVECFHLPKTANFAKDKKLLFSVEKKSESPLQNKNILKIAGDILKSPLHGTLPPSFMEKIEVIVTDKQKGEQRTKNWLVSSCVGSKDAFGFAARHKGFAPCGGVALQYENVLDKMIKPVFDDENRFLFCFLPLPEKCYLPIHLNGAFEVSKDRKQLARSTSDEKKIKDAKEWNNLLGRDISEAYYHLLTEMKPMCGNIDLQDWLKCIPHIPLPDENSCGNDLAKSLFSKLFNSSEELFPVSVENKVSWYNWKDIRMLSEDLPNELLDHGNKFMNWLFEMKKERKICLKIPEVFKSTVKKLEFDTMLTSSIISVDNFYEEFFQYVGNDKLEASLRNEIVKELLCIQSSSDLLKKLLVNTPCIATLPNGKLKRPSDLVKSGSLISPLFELEDEVYADTTFENHYDELQKLGINVYSLPWLLLLDRAKFIESKSRSGKENDFKIPLREKSQLLVQFIKSKIESCPAEIKSVLFQTAFVLVKQKPADTLFVDWYDNQYHFGPPNTMFKAELVDIVCCSALVCEERYDETLFNFLEIKYIPSFDQIAHQLKNLIAACQNNDTISNKAIEIFDEIYNQLESHHLNVSFSSLSSLKMLYTDNGKLALPCEVYLDIDQEIDGYMSKLPSKVRLHNRESMLKLGVKNYPSTNDYLAVLECIYEQNKNQPIPEILLKPILHSVAPKLTENPPIIGEIIYLPNQHNIMENITNMCFRDVHWLPDEFGKCYVHNEIPPVHCLKLGIKELRTDYFENNSIGLEFGQHEDLTTRINNLLRGYADTKDVLNEILQNADDAAATEVVFILDARQHGDKKVFSDQWKPLQGPALLVSNNGVFTQDDMNAIQMLGKGNKEMDPLKTGKYGVGFNAVYHLTDCPAILTDIEGKGSVFCIFDPNLKFAPGATELKPGRMFCNAREMFKSTYTDVKAAYLIDEYDSEGKTLFRFPLRTQEMARTSKLSNKVITVEEMTNTIQKLKAASFKSLLFLNNVKHITFKIISAENTVMEEEVITAEHFNISEMEINEFKCFRNSFVGNNMHLAKSIEYNICLKKTRKKILQEAYHLQIVEQYGFFNAENLEILKDSDNNNVYLVPKGGVARLLPIWSCQNCEQFKRDKTALSRFNDNNDVFCTLPLPEKSGVPVLINGHFVLDYETRRSLWTSRSECFQRLWNNSILTNCILPCYVKLLLSHTQDFVGGCNQEDFKLVNLRIHQFYQKFPVIKGEAINVGNYWDLLNKSFYKFMFNENEPLLVVHKEDEKEIQFCEPKKFLLYEMPDSTKMEHKTPLVRVLQTAGLNVDTLPTNIAGCFDACGIPLTKVSPAVITSQLKELNILPNDKKNLKVSETVLKTKENVIMLLEYCLKECTKDNKIDIEGLPLCLLADETLVTFSAYNKKFFTPFSNIIEGSENRFIHRDVWKIFSKTFGSKDFDCFEEFSLQQFSYMLEDMLPASKYKNISEPIKLADSDLSEDWLQSVWKYIESQRSKDGSLKLDMISSWSILLCKQQETLYLLPVSKSKWVLNLSAIIRQNAQLLKRILIDKVKVFESSHVCITDNSFLQSLHKDKIYQKNTAETVFGTIDVPEDLINALWYCFLRKQFKTVTSDDAQIILTSLCISTISEDLILIVKQLPLFEKFDGTVDSISGTVIILPDTNIPKNGLSIVEAEMNCSILKHSTLLETLFKTTYDIYGLYQRCIFQFFASFTDAMVYDHMVWIRNHVNLQIRYNQTSVEKNIPFQSFLNSLKNLKFVPCRNERKRACDLYDPQCKVFTIMLDDSFFPPSTYDGDDRDEWLSFLRNIGMITELSEEMFLRFAMELEYEREEEKALNASRSLCESLQLYERFSSPAFLENLTSINFIVPHTLNKGLEKIYPSKNSIDIKAGKRRICFESSTAGHCQNILWTVTNVLPQYAYEGAKEYANLLRIRCEKKENKNKPNCTVEFVKVRNHIINVSSSRTLQNCSDTCKELAEDTKEQLHKVMESIYEYLSVSVKQLSSDFKNVSFILVDKGNKMDIPAKVVLSDDYIIPPYLNAVWNYQGKYFDMFELLGCSKKPTAKHFLNVLTEIHMSCSKTVLHGNEQKAIKDAVRFFSNFLQPSDLESLRGLTLYLPTVTFQSNELHLIPSHNAIWVDDLRYEKRLNHFKENVLLSKYAEGPDTDIINNKLMEYLPVEMRPKKLSEAIIEELELSEAVQVGSDHVSEQIKTRFRSMNFIKAIERLIKHEQKISSCDSNIQGTMDTVINALKAVNVEVLKSVTTYFTIRGEKILDSESPKQIYLKLNKTILQIFFASSIGSTSDIYTQIARGLLDILHPFIKTVHTTILLPSLLEKPIDQLESFLDENDISRDASVSSFVRFTGCPTAGDFVPLELYGLLQNGIHCFKVGEYVAMEVEDEEDQSFIYVIIQSVGNEEDLYHREYGVQTTSDMESVINVKAYNLYSFCRFNSNSSSTDVVVADTENNNNIQSDVSSQTYEEAVTEIRLILKNASDSEKKTLVRRLYMRWHPDKNPPHKQELCTKVFQFIQNEVNGLNNDYTSCFQQWNTRARREARSTHDYFKRFRSFNFSSYEGFYVPPTFGGSNPQPREAKRWFKQAKFDMKSTENCQFPEWICFLAHQAAEKALKAARYLVHYGEDHSHNLITISANLSADLVSLARELESLIKSSAHLRYPNCWPFPGIPHSQYTQNDADRAVVITQQIVDIVEGRIQTI